jgi:hypothetical protein
MLRNSDHGRALRREWKSIAFWAIVALVAFWIVCTSESFQYCIHERDNDKAYSALYESPSIIRRAVIRLDINRACIGNFADKNQGSLIVFATFIVALFTFTLWRSTDKLWKAGNEALEVTERAFIFIDGFNTELTTAIDAKINSGKLPERYKSRPELFITRFAVQPKWKNGGNTPTVGMTIRINWRGPEGPVPPDYIYRNAPEQFFVAPRAIEPSEIIDMSAMPRVLVDHGLNPLGAEPMIFIWGRADYEDVFGRMHFIEWCYRLRMECYDGKCLRAHFIQWGKYNRTDENN